MCVTVPAKVTFTPTVQYLPFRLAGVVQCFIKANPPLQYVTWTKDKRLLEPYQTKDIIIMNNGSLLFTRVSNLFSTFLPGFVNFFKRFDDIYLVLWLGGLVHVTQAENQVQIGCIVPTFRCEMNGRNMAPVGRFILYIFSIGFHPAGFASYFTLPNIFIKSETNKKTPFHLYPNNACI